MWQKTYHRYWAGFTGFASHNFWHFAWVLDFFPSHSSLPKVPKLLWTDSKAGTAPSLVPVLFPSHPEVPALCLTPLAHVWMWEALSQTPSPSALKQVLKNLRPKRNMVHCLDSEFLFVISCHCFICISGLFKLRCMSFVCCCFFLFFCFAFCYVLFGGRVVK